MCRGTCSRQHTLRCSFEILESNSIGIGASTGVAVHLLRAFEKQAPSKSFIIDPRQIQVAWENHLLFRMLR